MVLIKTDETPLNPPLGNGALHHLFVYGTLKKEHGNTAHDRFLTGAKFIGRCAIPGVLVHLGHYPGLKADEVCRVTGEVWEVDSETIRACDMYEGCPTNYQRRRVMSPLGICWAYYKQGLPEQLADGIICVDRGLWTGGKNDKTPYHKVVDYYRNKRWIEPQERARDTQPVVPTSIPDSSPSRFVDRGPQINLQTGEVIGRPTTTKDDNKVVVLKPEAPVAPPIQAGPGVGVM